MTDVPPDVREEITTAHTSGVTGAITLGRSMSRKVDRREMLWLVLCVNFAGIVVAVVLSVLSLRGVSANTARQDAVDVKAASARAELSSAQAAYDKAVKANEELQKRGQQPVPVPPPQPNATQDTVTAAAVAQVLAALPARERPPTADEIAHQVAAYLAANPAGPTPSQLAAAVADYLGEHPPPAGEKGDQGVAGPSGAPGVPGEKGDTGAPPTAEQIMAAFGAAVASDPSLLCAGQGEFKLVRGVLTRPDPNNILTTVSVDIWTCQPGA